jgi:hypothetical protein
MLAAMRASPSRFSSVFSLVVLFAAASLWSACGGEDPKTPTTPPATDPNAVPPMPTPSLPPLTETAADHPALKIETTKTGDGAELKFGTRGRFHYTGYLPSGKVFDSTRANYKGTDTGRRYGEPMEFTFDNGHLIKGWLLGMNGMKVGEKRKLWIPADLGYGATGQGDIPPNSPLIFEVEYVGPVDGTAPGTSAR